MTPALTLPSLAEPCLQNIASIDPLCGVDSLARKEVDMDIEADILKELDQAPWDDIYVRLLAYTQRGLRNKHWLNLPGGPPPQGLEAHDIVQEAIRKVWEGTRKWHTHEAKPVSASRRKQDSRLPPMLRWVT